MRTRTVALSEAEVHLILPLILRLGSVGSPADVRLRTRLVNKITRARVQEQTERSYLIGLVKAITFHLQAMDQVMQSPSTVERGRRIGRLCSDLEISKDRAWHFGLGMPLDSGLKKPGRPKGRGEGQGSAQQKYKDKHRPRPLSQPDAELPPVGVLIESVDGEAVQCHVCGRWYGLLASHIVWKHGMNSAQYKERFGLARNTPLASEQWRAKQSRLALGRGQAEIARGSPYYSGLPKPKVGFKLRLSTRIARSKARVGKRPGHSIATT